MMEAYQKLEEEWGRWAKVSNVVACASGSAALHLALESLQLPPGSEVLVPDYTMIACPRAVVAAGLVPVFVDCDNDLVMDAELVSRNMFLGIRAVMPVHVYGRRCDIATIVKAAHGYVEIVEDLAEAHGVQPHPDTDAACWSFYKNKIVHGAEGGTVAFRNPQHAALARKLRCLGFTEAHDFMHEPRGWNHRMSNAHAELVLRSLERADAEVFLRRQAEAMYESLCPAEWRMPPRDAPWVYDLSVPGLTWERQTEVVMALNCEGIQARMGFKPMSVQQEFSGYRVIGDGNAARLSREVFYLPLDPGIVTRESVQLAFSTIHRVLRA